MGDADCTPGREPRSVAPSFLDSMRVRLSLGRTQYYVYVDAAYCYRQSSVVCLSVCYIREPCKTVEPIQMLFGLLARVGSRNRVLGGVQIAAWEGQF